MKKLKIPIILFLSLFLFTSCASLMSKEGTKESRAVADYKAIGQKLFIDTKANIDSICPVMPDADCRKAKRIFNYTVDIYDITGEYIKAVVDAENTGLYIGNATAKVLIVLKKAEYEPNIKTIIQGIDEIIQTNKEEDPSIKALKILQIINDKMFVAVAVILEDFIVEGE